MQVKRTYTVAEYTYKVVTRKGYLVHSSTVTGSLSQCVALFNSEHAPSSPVSYDKAFRKVKTQGLHVEFSRCTWEVGSGALLPLVVIFSVAEPETLPAKAATLFDELQESNTGFQKGMGMAELGAIAQAINSKVVDTQLTAEQATKLAEGLLGKFGKEWALEVAATIVRVRKQYEPEYAAQCVYDALAQVEAFADKVIADVDAFKAVGGKATSYGHELPF